MSHAINRVVLGAVLVGASSFGHAQTEEPPLDASVVVDAPLESSVIRDRCLDSASEHLEMSSLEVYWVEVKNKHDKLDEIGRRAGRGWAQRNIIDRTTFELAYGTNYKLTPGDDVAFTTTSEGTTWGLTYKLPLSALFTWPDQHDSIGEKEVKGQEAALASARAEFMNLMFDFKIAVAKHEEEPKKKSVLYSAERLADKIGSLSPEFRKNCLES